MVATCLAVTSACNHEAPEPATELGPDEHDTPAAPGAVQAPADPQAYGGCGPLVPIDPGKFEFIPIELIEDVFIRRLPEPTPLGEDIVIHVRFPELGDPSPQPSLVRVLGVKEAPVLMFHSDTLAELGHLEKSPGPGFFATFARSDDLGLERRKELESQILENDKVADLSFVIEGRHPIAVSTAQPFAIDAFMAGDLVGLGRVRITPQSIEQNWGESVFITDPAVVQDPERTHDTCTQEGDACGPWTFCHLMTEMANTPRTGISPEQFTQQWLEQWLDDYPVNDDLVEARPDMASLVIEPWLAASGGSELDLTQSPFRLLAIVNRLDLRQNGSSGFGGYGGGGGSTPQTGGELRFVFGVMAPDGSGAACNPLPFTVIFEYGVPKQGCFDVREWANEWVALDLMGGFDSTYRDALANLTEVVVQREASPLRGNGSAINQIRTNENALADVWELREFAVADQSFGCVDATNVATDGFLRPHTVLQTPDDHAYTPTPNGTIDDFVASDVIPFVSTSPCRSTHQVPASYDCSSGSPDPFLGGNALASLTPGGSPPGAWLANPPGSATSAFICGRHEFSLNTCQGCHTCDTGTTFTHVDPMSGIPAALSGFLVGATVDDTQFPGTTWSFADLDRRYQDLYDVAGAFCLPFTPVIPEFFEKVGFDPIGPVIDLDLFKTIFDVRLGLSQPDPVVNPLIEDIGRGPLPSH
ncbi:MAG TPA: hypothetical protein VFG69_21660 [Nannocystaceae bacterium]|nr:hypothetical protein [Nannocystaceae bacterium]